MGVMPREQQLLRVALAQINPTVGDIAGNARRIAEHTSAARDGGAGLVVFPELTLSGYPPEDLLLKTSFLDACADALAELASQTHGIVALVGFPERAEDVYNAAAVLADGEVVAVYRKMYLPNYGVFDEQRYFQSGAEAAIFELNGIPIGISICEDIWEPGPPAMTEALGGAQVIVNLSASPYRAGYGQRRERMLVQRAVDYLAAVVFVNTVGGQDELVFDGHSLAIDQDGTVLTRCPQFEEALSFCTIDPREVAAARLRDTRHRVERPPPAARRDGRRAARVHARERERRVGGRRRGGRARAHARARGGGVRGAAHRPARLRREERLRARAWWRSRAGSTRRSWHCSPPTRSARSGSRCVSMPSPYSSEGTRADARAIAENLGVDFREISIADAMRAYDEMLADSFAGTEPDITEENVQARIRGNVVMALSNKFGWLVLTTGNKSEMSVGYATLYGDMAGGFAVLKDVYKGWVYRLVRWRNEQAGRELVPGSVLERPPSAELRYEQRDDDSLPPYELLDADARGLHRGGPGRGRAGAARAAGRRGRARDRDGRPRRVQAPSGAAGNQDLDQGVRARPAAPDHQPLREPRRRRSCGRRDSVEGVRLSTRESGDQRLAVWLAALAVPLLGLVVLLAAPSADGMWEHHPSHFWLVLAAAVTSAGLALSTSGIALHRADARLFLVSLAFLSAAGFLALHALATPGVLLDGPNQGFTIATSVGLLLAALFAAASALPLPRERAQWVIRNAACAARRGAGAPGRLGGALARLGATARRPDAGGARERQAWWPLRPCRRCCTRSPASATGRWPFAAAPRSWSRWRARACCSRRR